MLRWSWAASERPVIPFFFFPTDRFYCSGDLFDASEIVAVVQHRPGQAQVLGSDGDSGFPVTASLDQVSGPTTEAVLLVAESRENRSGAHDEQAAQVGIAGLGDPSESGFAATAVLPGDESSPGGELPTVLEVVSAAQTGDQSAGGGRADTGQLHQAPAALVLFGGLRNGQAVFLDTLIQPVCVNQQVADAAVGPAGEFLEMGADFPAQPFDFLRQNNAELADQAAQAVVERGAFFNKPLPGTVQAEDGLLIDILDRDEAHVGPGDRFADGGSVGRIVLAALAAHPVRRHKLGGHQFDGVAEATEFPCPVVRTGAGFHANQTGRQVGDYFEQLAASHLGLDKYRFAILVNAMQSEYILGEIDADGDNIHGLPLSNE